MIGPEYRLASFVCCVMAFSIQLTGINAINLYATQIFQKIIDESPSGSGISPPLGGVLNVIAQVAGCIVSPFAAYFKFRTILNGGFGVMSVAMFVVTLLAYKELNTILVGLIMVFGFVFQVTVGTYSWVYLGQVACDEGLSIATFFLWFGVFILTIWTNKMMEVL